MKIKLSFITPTAYIKDYQSQGDFVLALSHLIDLNKENEYEKAIKEINLPIIIDNGLFENHIPEPVELVIKKGEKIGATHFFASDYLYDHKKTLQSLVEAVDKKERMNSSLKIAAVVQADNKQDYMTQLKIFNSCSNVDLIGLSILSIPKSFGGSITESRIELMKEMIKLEDEVGGWKNCHLLGQGSSQADLIFAKNNCPFIISNDSSCIFQSGLFGKRLTEKLEVPGGKVKEKVNFGLDNITDKQKKDIQYNIDICKRILQLP